MPRRQKNLLEAFSKSGVEKHQPKLPGLEPKPEPAPKPKKVKPKAKAPVRRPEPVIPRRSRFDVDPRRLAVLAGVIVVLLIVVAVGRFASNDVAAEGPDPASNAMLQREAETWAATPVEEPAANAGLPADTNLAETNEGSAPESGADGASFYTEDDRAFYDPANRFTVRVIEFRNDERGKNLAWNCYYYLRDEGLPAITPLGQGSSIILYVGASSNTGELQKVAEYISGMRGPPPQSRPGEFDGAYLVNIEDQIERAGY